MQVLEAPVTTFSTIDGAATRVREPQVIRFVKPAYKETKRPVESAVVFAPALWQWD